MAQRLDLRNLCGALAAEGKLSQLPSQAAPTCFHPAQHPNWTQPKAETQPGGEGDFWEPEKAFLSHPGPSLPRLC